MAEPRPGKPISATAYKSMQDRAWKRLSSAERDAVSKYALGWHSHINKRLRTGEPHANAAHDRDLRTSITALDRAIAKSKLTHATVLYRGVTHLDDAHVGDVLPDPAFMSATIEPSMAAHFAGSRGRVVHIYAPAGTHAHALSGASEREMLLARDTLLEVFRVNGRDIYATIVR
jgi:hypothetical protein